MVVDGVADEVSQSLLEGGLHRLERRQTRLGDDLEPGGRPEQLADRLDELRRLCVLGDLAVTSDARVRQQVDNKLGHQVDAAAHRNQVLRNLFGRVVSKLLLDPVGEVAHGPQRSLQIVRSDGGKLLEVGIGPRQLGGLA